MQALPPAINESSFGNTSNPFNELEVDEYELGFLGTYNIAAKMIDYLNQAYLHGEQIVSRQEDHVTYRSLSFDCSAPYWWPGNLYLDGAAPAHLYDTGWKIKPEYENEIRSEPARLTLGDSTANGAIIARWIRLTSPSSNKFGINSIENNTATSTLPNKRWDAITICLFGYNCEPYSRVWATEDSPENPESRILFEPNEAFDALNDSFCRAISRTRVKNWGHITSLDD